MRPLAYLVTVPCCVVLIALYGCSQENPSAPPSLSAAKPPPSAPIVAPVRQPVVKPNHKAPKPSKQDAALEEFLHPKPSGLSLARQQQMFYEKADIENKDEKKLDRLFPEEHLERIHDQKAVSKIVLGRAAYSSKLEDKLNDHIMKRYHITYAQMCDINLRGIKAHWPLPPGSPENPPFVP